MTHESLFVLQQSNEHIQRRFLFEFCQIKHKEWHFTRCLIVIPYDIMPRP